MFNLIQQAVSTHTVLLAVLSGIIYGGLFYWKNTIGEDPEAFNWIKFTATLVVAAIVGGVAGATGNVVTQTTVDLQVAAYGFYVIILDQILKIVYKSLYPHKS